MFDSPSETDRIEPSLLDKLEPIRNNKALSLRDFRSTVLRDLSWLLNTIPLGESIDLNAYPEIQSSVVNFGWTDLIGSGVMKDTHLKLKASLARVIEDFEPRIKVGKLDVWSAPDATDRHLVIEIEGALIAKPYSMSLYLKAEIDGGEGAAHVTDFELSDRE